MNKALNIARVIKVHRLKPIINKTRITSSVCSRCRFINESSHSFCSNCGWPVQETQHLHSLYRSREKHRKELLSNYHKAISSARSVLYIVGGLCLSGIGFLFSENDERFILFALTIVMAALFVLLGRWSIYKPFTALLVSFVVIITFSTISVFGRLLQSLTSTNGLYTILLSMVIVYFLLRGIQAAYKADLINEEFEIT